MYMCVWCVCVAKFRVILPLSEETSSGRTQHRESSTEGTYYNALTPGQPLSPAPPKDHAAQQHRIDDERLGQLASLAPTDLGRDKT